MQLFSTRGVIRRGVALAVSVLGSQFVFAGDDHGHEHAGDFIVGVSGNGQLALEFDFDENSFLPPVSGLLNGWALDDPGFMALAEDEPAEDFFTLDAGASVRFEVISVSSALQAWTPGFGDMLDLPGELWTLGGPGFDEHPTWHINSDSPDFDPQQVKWFFSFRLIDEGSTGYAASQVYTVAFTNVDPDQPIPTVSTWGLIILALLLLAGGSIYFRHGYSRRQPNGLGGVKSVLTLMFALMIANWVQPAWAGPVHEDVDVVVGRTAEGQLSAEYSLELAELPPVMTKLQGWLLGDPGFLSLPEDEPDEGFFTLEPGAIIALEVIEFDSALQAWTPGFASMLRDPGDTWEIGAHEFDEHPTWHINSADPEFEPNQVEWHATFRLIDQGTTGYLPSEPIALGFTPVPEPVSILSFLLGTAFVIRTRTVRSRINFERSAGR